MWVIWLREWRELRQRWPAGLALAGLAAAVAWWAPARWALPALSGLAALAAAGSSAPRLWRERRSGGLGRLALTGLSPARLLGARVGARAAAAAALILPAVAVLGLRAGIPAPIWPAALAVLGTVMAATATGAVAGLRARGRWQVHQGALAAAALAWAATRAAALPGPAPAAPGPYAGAAVLPVAGLQAGLLGPALLLAVCWLAPYLIDSG